MEELEQVLKEFADLIVATKPLIDRDGEDDGFFEYKLSLTLKNSNRLVIEERMTRLGYRYSYQWMGASNTLIIRWDNAPNHLDVSLHHKHVGNEDNVQPSEPMTLRNVLAYIAKVMGLLMLFWCLFF